MLSLSSLFLKEDPAARSRWASLLRTTSCEVWEPDHGCRMLGLQFSVVLPQFLRLEPRGGRRWKRKVWFPNWPPNPECRETWKEKDSPSRLGDGRFKKQGTYLQGLSWVQGGGDLRTCPPESESFPRNLNRIRACFQSKRQVTYCLLRPALAPASGKAGSRSISRLGREGSLHHRVQLRGQKEGTASLSVTLLTQSSDPPGRPRKIVMVFKSVAVLEEGTLVLLHCLCRLEMEIFPGSKYNFFRPAVSLKDKKCCVHRVPCAIQ